MDLHSVDNTFNNINTNGSLTLKKEEEKNANLDTQYSLVQDKDTIKVYKIRWLVLFIFMLYTTGSFIQTMQYVVIADVIVDYYQVSNDAVNWTVLIFPVTQIIFSIGGTYVVDKIGLKKSILIGAVGTAVGSWIKIGGIHPDRFWVILTGQVLIAFFQVPFMAILPGLSATWFAHNQVAIATSFGILGLQVGSSLSFLLPPLLIWKGSVEDVGRRLYIVHITYAAFSTIVLPFIFFFFTAAPPTPPSHAKQEAMKETNENPKTLMQTLKLLFSNRSYVIYGLILGMNFAIMGPLQILSNQVILHYYPEAAQDVGFVGLLNCLLTMVGTMTISFILDKYKLFKESTWTLFFVYLVMLAFYTGTIDQGMPFVYATFIIKGIVCGAMVTLNFELIIELTYPLSEAISVAIIVNWAQLLTVLFTHLFQYLLTAKGIFWCNIIIVILVASVDVLFFFMKFDLRRKAVQDRINKTENNKLNPI